MKQKRKVIIAAFAFAAALLIGWKIKPVELIDDKLLIDLDTTIVEAGWGQEGNPSDTPDKPTPGDGDSEGNQEDKTEVGDPDEKGSIIVSIRGEKIYLDNVLMRDTAVLRSNLSQKCEAGDSIILEDNYAEAHVYKDVLQVLEMIRAMEDFKLSEIAR